MSEPRYRDARTVAAAVERVPELEPERLLGAIRDVHDATVRGMNAGADVHTSMREVTLPPELEVGEGYGKVSWSVRAIREHHAGRLHFWLDAWRRGRIEALESP
jgi:hypothetical protein